MQMYYAEKFKKQILKKCFAGDRLFWLSAPRLQGIYIQMPLMLEKRWLGWKFWKIIWEIIESRV